MPQETLKGTSKNEAFAVGTQLTYQVFSFESEYPSPVTATIDAIKGGGFYGQVLLMDNGTVIKTAQPDGLHEFFRRLNWKLEPFPSQYLKEAAQLDHLAMNIIHKVVTRASQGRITTPRSYGYTHLPGVGYAQVIERIHGRGARFDTKENENDEFRTIRHLLWSLSVEAGFEHGGQVHPDNPFGKPNLRKQDDGTFIWLDLLPAIRHTGFVLPFYYFRFHKDIRSSLAAGGMTFNHIHTDTLIQYLRHYQKDFTQEEMKDLTTDIIVYQATHESYTDEQAQSLRNHTIAAARARGKIDASYAEKLLRSDKAYSIFFSRTILDPILRTAEDFVQGTLPYRLVFDEKLHADIRRFMQDKNFQHEKLIELILLYGPKAAREEGLISETEYAYAMKLAENPPKVTKKQALKLLYSYAFLQASYEAISQLVFVGQAAYAVDVVIRDPDWLLVKGAAVAVAGWLTNALLRYPTSKIIGRIRKEDLHTAATVSLIPAIGRYIAVVSDLLNKLGDRGEFVAHYTKRYWIARFSKVLRPWGGWNSDLEAHLWNQFFQPNPRR